MKQFMVGCLAVVALVVMGTSQVIGPMGLAIKGGEALAADIGRPPPPPPPPPPAPIGKGKAPIGKGKGKAPVAPVVTTRG